MGLGGNSLEDVDKEKSPTELPLSVGNFPINAHYEPLHQYLYCLSSSL